METVTLKNGATEALASVKATMLSLYELYKSDPLAFYDLTMICRTNGEYEPNSTISDRLVELGLLELEITVHGTIRNIVLSAVKGESLDMKLANPIRED